MAMLILGFLLHRWVLNPIAGLTKATEHIQRGNYDIEPPIVGKGRFRRYRARSGRWSNSYAMPTSSLSAR